MAAMERRPPSSRCSAACLPPSALSMSTYGRSMPSGARPALRTGTPEAARVTTSGCRSRAPISRTPSTPPATSCGVAMVEVAEVAVITVRGIPWPVSTSSAAVIILA